MCSLARSELGFERGGVKMWGLILRMRDLISDGLESMVGTLQMIVRSGHEL